MPKQTLFKRPMSLSLAESCEWAIHPKCVCRCNGLLHSLKHNDFVEEYNKLWEEQGEVSEEAIQEIVRSIRKLKGASKE